MIQSLRKELFAPIVAYEVSGEFAAIELMYRNDLIDGPAAHVESWTSLIRAGAHSIITYGARYASEWLRKRED